MKPQALFGRLSVKTWTLLFMLCLYFVFCWVLYTATVEPLYGFLNPPSISADSDAYFQIAGLAKSDRAKVDVSGLVGYGGSPLGPITVALIGRTVFGVACINCVIFLMVIWWAGMVHGAERPLFALLVALNPQTIPTLMTLNKEVLAMAGIVAFAAYLYPRKDSAALRNSKWLLVTGIVFSILARWEQVAILFWFLAAQSKRWPFKANPRRAVVILLLVCSVAYAAAVHVLHINLAGFLVQLGEGGTVVRLYHIQEAGGYFLVAAPKILMNLAGRWVTPGYFFTVYWTDVFGKLDWQNVFIGPLHSLVMLVVIGVTFWKRRFRLSRPLIHLAVAYFIFTAINPFIQPRYMYPGFVLVALELSRRKDALEPAPELPSLPALPPSYRALPTGQS